MQNNRKIVYVTGISGTGKTTLAKEFAKQGFVTIDIDEYSHWEHRETGERNHWLPEKDREFLDTHVWVCDLTELKKVFEKYIDNDVFVFGLIKNEKETFPLFDKIILLQIDLDEAWRRIDQREDNIFGKGETEREWIKSWKDDFEKDWIERGAVPVSAEDSIEVVMENILNICK